MHSEEELIAGCGNGERQLQRELYERYSRQMLVVCMRYAKSQQEAEDVLQEAFIKVFDHIKKFRKDSSLGYWIKKIVINTALNHRRKKLYLYPMVDVQDINLSQGPDFPLADIHFKDLLNMIQELPTGCQVIFNLYAIEGYKHHEIAQMLEINEGTSKSQYARAKNLLKEKLTELEKINYGKLERS